MRFHGGLAHISILTLIRFEDAKLELLDLSLIRLNDENGRLAIHRVIQEVYWTAMTDEQEFSTFRVAWLLLDAVFPKSKGVKHMYPDWAKCELNIHNVLALQQRFVELGYQNFAHVDTQYVILICEACR